jgi:hypothetical protein
MAWCLTLKAGTSDTYPRSERYFTLIKNRDKLTFSTASKPDVLPNGYRGEFYQGVKLHVVTKLRMREAIFRLLICSQGEMLN